nr:glycosyltransferase [Tessaracoccus sp. ZS01]
MYRGRLREPSESKSILVMRAFTARNYGNDIALKAIRLLSTRRGFGELSFTISGFGPLFQKKVDMVRHLPNVHAREAYSRPIEMASLHYDHGIFLCPSRFDTHGVMLGEAMSSGMATVTNAVAAIPEFTDSSASVLVKPDDPIAFADGLWHLIENPELLPVLSRNAMARVAAQCSREQTVDREIAIIRQLGA